MVFLSLDLEQTIIGLIQSEWAYFLFGIPMILCMFFPIVVQNSYIYDLRLIPLILACLYSSFFISFLLYLTLNFARFMITANTGAYLSMISTLFPVLVIMIIIRRYPSLSLIKKILASSLILFISKIIGISPFLLKYNDFNFQLLSAINFYVVQSVFIGLAIYIIESIKKNAQLHKEVIDSEKMIVASTIAASVAHEIRNPLTVIRGFVQLLSASDLTLDKKNFTDKYV
jgi:two-component system sporulation sensor kinase B